MMPNILNLPDFKAQRVDEADHDYHVYAEVPNIPGVCTACGLVTWSATVELLESGRL